MARHKKSTRRPKSRRAKMWKRNSFAHLLARRMLLVRPKTTQARVRYQDLIATANRKGRVSNAEAESLLDMMRWF